MTTNKPEVVKYIVPKHEAWDVRTLVSPRLSSEQLMVLASDYESLQAECENLRKDAERFRTIRDRLAGPTFDKHFFLELYNVGAFDQPQSR